jgi:hypothetical protein
LLGKLARFRNEPEKQALQDLKLGIGKKGHMSQVFP